ncbi:lipopolysaccharide biosynthesis protein [Amycolatopsis benzoatilytica]|uniref:lipopolysaccharide biosynthesis protein n=1 Tax=Amycolatopsis benzoatilytica TaxID=346045 RepID=UPI00037F38F2|nr:lipopolysaccharide biosynthesis protein [Amycolatopsis benzoatilytica]
MTVHRPGSGQPPAPDSALPADTAAATAAHGARWTVIAMIARQFGRLGFALVLARLLGPADFGVASAATIYVSLTAVLLETGLATGIVQKAHLRREDEGAAFWTVTALGTLVAVLTVAFSGAIADFLAIPQLRPVLMILATGPVLKGLAIVSAARLQRDLRFRALSLGEVAATLLGGAIGIVAAEFGMHYWALVVQQVCTDLLVLLIWLGAAGLPAFVLDRTALRYVRRFGVPLLGSQALGYVGRNADNVVVSHFLGAAALSYYMVPYRIMLVPVSLLGNVANRVAFPIFARTQDDPQRVRSLFLRVTQVIAVPVVPGMLAVAALAPDVVRTVFGAEWGPAVPVVIALATTGILESLTTPGGSVFMGLGRADLALRWSWIPLLVCVPAFFAGLPWGVTGVAAAYSLATLALTPFQVAAIGRVAAFRLGDWLRAVWPAVAAGVPATAAGWLANEVLETGVGIPVPAALCASLATVAVLYLALLRLIDRQLFRESLEVAKLLMKGKLGGVSAKAG